MVLARGHESGRRDTSHGQCLESPSLVIEIISEMSSPAISQVLRPAPSSFSHAEVMRVIFGVMICILLVALDQTAVVPAIPAIASDLGSFAGLSRVVAGY